MSFDTPQAAAELKARSGELQQALEQSGFDLSGGMSFDVAGDRGQGGQAQNQQPEAGAAFRGRAFQAALDTTADAARPRNSSLRRTALAASISGSEDAMTVSRHRPHRHARPPPHADATTKGLGSLADNFNTFLTLLTTQLKNQDPTAPLDSNQFTQQLVQMTGVEQQLNANTLLKQVVANTSNGISTRGRPDRQEREGGQRHGQPDRRPGAVDLQPAGRAPPT